MSLLDRLRACTAHDSARLRPWRIGDTVAGWVAPPVADLLDRRPGPLRPEGRGWRLDERLDGPEARAAALEEITDRLIEAGLVRKRRDERYPMVSEWGAPLLATVDRGAAVALGIKSFGIHLNGVVEAADGPLLWVAKRAADRALAPGKLDNLVAGGQPAGLSLAENLVKECAEEAAIPAELARRAVPAGAITYMMDTAEGLRRDTLFVYDLALAPDFTPRNTDGEVESFARRPLAAVLEQLRDTEDFKFNVALVIIDLAIRRGIVGPEEPDYLALCRGLREPTDPPSHPRAG
ncbi:DUF4743 domain-containing protein [Inquilinus limosus]|uniref:Nudix hydrolase domain-containing protein n=1 Tax=Inquilinus limosus TaxID=171674 RepID=A0A211YSE1_9PROT|nr:DUF4743 domain-containing protein [Inquilinus limosus]OWJ55844.1 hypothetical protein BWR60_35920 [Inquilinus limosus]